MDGDGQGPTTSENPANVLPAGLVPPGDLLRGRAIVDGDRANGDVLGCERGRFEERRAEGQHLRPGARRAFREDCDWLFPLQRIRDGPRLVLRGVAAFAADVDGRILVREPVDEPVAEIVFGDEGAPGVSAKDQYIEPAHMVGNDEAVRRERMPHYLDPDSEIMRRGRQEPTGPVRAAQDQLRSDVNGPIDEEKPDEPCRAQDRAQAPAIRLVSGCGRA